MELGRHNRCVKKNSAHARKKRLSLFFVDAEVALSNIDYIVGQRAVSGARGVEEFGREDERGMKEGGIRLLLCVINHTYVYTCT